MRLGWEQLALSQSLVESAGSGCMMLPPGYILVWGLEKTKAEVLNKLVHKQGFHVFWIKCLGTYDGMFLWMYI